MSKYKLVTKPIYPINPHAYNMRCVAERDGLARKEGYVFDRKGSGAVQWLDGDYVHFEGPLTAQRQFRGKAPHAT